MYAITSLRSLPVIMTLGIVSCEVRSAAVRAALLIPGMLAMCSNKLIVLHLNLAISLIARTTGSPRPGCSFRVKDINSHTGALSCDRLRRAPPALLRRQHE